MTLEELRKVGSVQLEIMDEVHRLCVKHGITYYMIAGTLLGAIRHKGFIPWDLDIDIGMPRQDYDRFREVCAEELGANCVYLDLDSHPNYIRPHALVMRKDTRLQIKYDDVNPKTMDLGIYLDVFPLDNAPDEEALRQKQAKQLVQLRKFKSWRLPYSYSRKKWKRYAHYAVSGLLSFTTVARVNAWQQQVMMRHNGTETACLCSMASQYAYKKQCMPREIYGKPTLLGFEGRLFYGPEKYTEYLTRLYGDYMQLPPEEKRRANLEIYTKVEFL